MIRTQDTQKTFPYISFKVGKIGKISVFSLLVTISAISFTAGEDGYDVYHPNFLQPQYYQEPQQYSSILSGHLNPFPYYVNDLSSKNESAKTLHDMPPAPVDIYSYDKFSQPNHNGTPTDVYFHVTILNIDNINEELMTYESDIILIQKWKDSRLRLGTGKKVKDYQELDVNWIMDMWRPDCFFKNAKSVKTHDRTVPNHFLWLYNDKTLLYMVRLSLTLSCPMKFEKYPHDKQICKMEIESLSHTINDQVFHWDDSMPLAIDPNINLPNFNIGTTSTGIHLREYFPGKFHCVEVGFELRRKLGHHVFHTYIPSALIVALSLLSFWIRAEATAVRITVCVTLLLILVTQNVVQSVVILPKVSGIKAIDVWMWFCTAIAIVALLDFALVNQFIERGYQLEKSTFGDIYELDTTADLQSQIQFAGSTLSDYTPSLRKNNRIRNMSLKLDKISRFLFPIAFLIFNIVYWSIVLI